MPKNPIKEKKTAIKASKRHNLHNVHEANGFAPHTSHHRTKHRNINLQNLNPGVTLGIIAMGLAGAATFVLFNTKKHTKTIRGNLYSKYQNFKDEAGEYAHEALERGRRVYDSAADYAENIRDAAHDAMDQPYSSSLLLAGAIGGTLLGATSVYFLNRFQQESEHSHEFLDKMMHVFGSVKQAASSMVGKRKSHGWLESAKKFVESIQESITSDDDENEREEEYIKKLPHSSPLRDAIHLGFIGLRLWENMAHRRR
jgi:hypothetical protein